MSFLFAKSLTLLVWGAFWAALIFLREKGKPGINKSAVQKIKSGVANTAGLVIAGYIFIYFLFWLEVGVFNFAGAQAYYLPAAIFGVIFLVVGFFFAATGRIYLASGWGVFNIISPSQGIVKDGPYKYTRHPTYFGFLLIWLGSSLVFFNWAGIFMFFVFFLPLILIRAKNEEKVLLEIFGRKYEKYQEETGFILPGLKKL